MGSINKCEIIDGQKVLTPFVQTNSVEDYYSTEEEATNKVWIDGKRIYRRVYQGVTNGASLGISDLNDIVLLRAISSPKLGADRWQAMPWAYNDNETAIGVSTSLTWSIQNRDGYIPSTALSIILEYTKA